MANMFGLPNIPIGDEANANHVRSRYSRNVIISYPTEEDWRRLYDKLVVHEIALYASMRQSHQRSVSTQLRIISATSSGRAVFSELSAAPHEVMIFPFDFQHSSSWKSNTADFKTLGITTSHDSMHVRRRGMAVCGKNAANQAVCTVAEGGGGRPHIFFTASRVAGSGNQSADEVLFHELVHAARFIRGLLMMIPMNGGYGNQEEFLAQVIENIYRSEKGRSPTNYGGGPMPNPSGFLDSAINPSPRLAIGSLRSNPVLWSEIVKCNARFNPVRQVDLESKAYVAKIEREN
jgi:hypothetical protein